MPVSNLQIYNAVNAYKKQQKSSGSLQQKHSVVSPLNKNENGTSEEESNPAIDVEEKDDN